MTSSTLKMPVRNNENHYNNNEGINQYNNAMMLNSNTVEPLLSGLLSPRSMNSGTGGTTSASSGNSSSGPITTMRSRLQQQTRNNDSGNSSGSESNPTPPNNRVQETISDNNASNSNSSNDDDDSIDTNESTPTKRKYRRHAKPDRNAPVKPPSAYIMFSNDSRAELKDQNLSFAELAKIVGDQWKNLSHVEKQAYERMAMRAKDEYLAALEQYRQTSHYSHYQEYLNDFKAKQEAANRLICRSRKREKPKSPGR